MKQGENGSLIIRVLRVPAHNISHFIYEHIPHNKKHSKVAIGVTLMVVGSFVAVELKQHFLPHWIQDCVAWFIHGCGATPVIEVALGRE